MIVQNGHLMKTFMKTFEDFANATRQRDRTDTKLGRKFIRQKNVLTTEKYCDIRLSSLVLLFLIFF